MLGVILSGGQSNRMGSDKGLIDSGTGYWAIAAADKLAMSCQIPVVISVNKQQEAAYAYVSTQYPLVVDADQFGIKGPLLGILSVHAVYPGEDFFVFACDMPYMEGAILQELKSISAAKKADAYLFANDEEYEPLCAIYTAKGLSHLHSMAKNKRLEKHSMKYALTQITRVSKQLDEAQKKFFANINERSDLKRF